MTGWMIYPRIVLDNKYGNNAFDWMIDSAKSFGIDLKVLFKEDILIVSDEDVIIYHNKQVMDTPDFVIMRCYNEIISSQLQALGIRMINSTKAMFDSRNKVIAGTQLKKEKVPTPKFVYSQMLRDDDLILSSKYKEISNSLGGEFVLKVIDGSCGENVFLIQSQEDFIDKVKLIPGDFLCQEYIKTSFGKDIRTWVIGDKVIGAVLRESDYDFRSNFALGGKATKIQLTDEIKNLSLQAAKALNLEYCGIDLLLCDNDYTVCEVNGNAGFRTLSQVTDIDMGHELFKYISS